MLSCPEQQLMQATRYAACIAGWAHALQEASRGFWCCDRKDCSYREFPQERKQTPQVALEISGPDTFVVRTGTLLSSVP